MLLLIVAGLGVDASRYLLVRNKVQLVADGAALAAASNYKQVRTLDEIDQKEVLSGALDYIKKRRSFNSDLYEYTSTMNTGDVLADSFVQPGASSSHADTFFRVGINVKHVFEPYFLPRYVFGDRYFTVQAQAVAEAEPVFSRQNMYDPVGPATVTGPLQHAVYSRHHIKAENLNVGGCFTVNGSMHADSGVLTLENMSGSGCSNGGKVDLNGNVEANDRLDAGGSCSSGAPGCIVINNVDGTVDGDLIYETGLEESSGPTVNGERKHESPGSDDMPIPDSPDESPDEWPGPICVIENPSYDWYTVTDPSQLVGQDGTDCSSGGTFYVKGGSLKVQDFTWEGDYSFVAEDNVKFEGVQSHTTNDGVMYAEKGWIKVLDINSDLELNATFYAPQTDTTDPGCFASTPGCVKFEDAGGNNITINGGIVAGTNAKFENVNDLTFNFQGHEELLSEDVVENNQALNDIPDYWNVRLVE